MKHKAYNKQRSVCCLLHSGFDLEDAGDIFLQNTGLLSLDYMG
jgi:hypothetical protein